MKPTIGRIVHYYNESLEGVGPFAAIVTNVFPGSPTDCVNLTYFDRNGNVSTKGAQTSIPFEGTSPGFSSWWCWPPRE